MIHEKTIAINKYITETYSKNQENCNDDYGCVLCGKKITKSAKYFVVCSMNQHNVYTKKDVLELGYSFIEKNDGGFMYNYPIGNDCYRKYVKGNEVLESVVFKQGELFREEK
tara:strand:- start:243 stop:578 length:336 start_codon:yes stop_codon:yes gene_type:complete